MINLTPIAKPIQERMFEKMKVLGREKVPPGEKKTDPNEHLLEMKDMATRTTFIRMTSGQENPVVMMGGELKPDGSMISGYKDIYESRTINLQEQVDLAEAYTMEDYSTYSESELDKGIETRQIKRKFKRPMPGIKSIDVQFKGGVRALRTANISWTCWSFADLDRLMPHFLSHGKTVALEWGWVYNKKQFEQLQTLIKSDGTIDEDGFKDYREKINKTKGDFDFMNGVVKNFEYTTRDDGGFDCKTDIVSTGVNILNSKSISGKSANRLKLYNVKEDDRPNEILRKLNEIKDDDEQLKQIFYDSELSFSIFMTRFDRWLTNLVTAVVTQEFENPQTGEVEARIRSQKGKYVKDNLYQAAGNYNYVKNSFIVEMDRNQAKEKDEEGIVHWDGWVRWGWFEDNVLNKFCAMISKDNANEPSGILNEFRSVNRIIEKDIPTDKFESVRIKNHQFLESTNLKKYILPGQFEVGSKMTLENEGKDIKTLSNIINDTKNFKSFAVGSTASVSTVNSQMVPLNELSEKELDEWKKSGAYDADSDASAMTQYANAYEQSSQTVNSAPLDKSEGYLRNILVHTEFLKECFDFTENITINIGLQNMFDGMREDHNLWDWTIEADPVEASRMKIIDNNVTFYPWDLGFDPKEQKSEFNDVGELISRGVFTFPVWKNN
ncbi:MAG: hypothetical protein QF864_03785, partial [SAR202 cluster bacterium]|nr:hypothetical protein [SAR202 cluster bacterium]